MNAIFARAGIDYVQWKAVSWTLLRSDYRSPTPQADATYSLRSLRGPLMIAFVFGMYGLAMVPVIILNPDPRLTGTVTLIYFMSSLATALLTQHGATMLSSADHVILGPRPLTARTVFAIRLTNLLFHTLLITTCMAYPPVAAFTLAHGVNLWRGLAAAAAIYLWAIAVAFAVVASYAALLRWIGSTRLKRALGYLQMLTGVAAYGGIFIVREIFERRSLMEARLPDGPWLFAVPPAWFASYLEIANGASTVSVFVRAALSVALVGGLAMLLRGRLVEDYTLRLAEANVEERKATRVLRRGQPWLFGRDEARAVTLLTRAHFRHDLRLRMSLFGMVPFLFIYMVAGLREGNADPFLGAVARRGPDLLGLMALLFPAVITRHLAASEGYQASWIYSVTTADRGRLIVTAKNIAAVYFLVPFMALLAALLSWRFGNAVHGAIHAVMLTLVGHIALQTAVIVNPRLPFAQPPAKTSGSSALLGWMLFVMIGGQLALLGLTRYIYPMWSRVGFCAAALVVGSMVLERAVRWRAAQ